MKVLTSICALSFLVLRVATQMDHESPSKSWLYSCRSVAAEKVRVLSSNTFVRNLCGGRLIDISSCTEELQHQRRLTLIIVRPEHHLQPRLHH